MLVRVHVVVEDPELRSRICEGLDETGVLVTVTAERARLWDRLRRQEADLIIIAEAMLPPPPTEGVALLRALPDEPNVVVLADREDAEERARLLIAGAAAVLHRDLPPAILSQTLRAMITERAERRRLQTSALDAEPTPRLNDFVSDSPTMQMFLGTVQRLVAVDSSLLIVGETGVGKEHLARAIHAESPRSRGPFVAVSCAAIPDALLESELFGHERGAFTGAVRPRRGYFELAHGGTIFLDEIGDMPLYLQGKLLRVLQDRAIQKVGGERVIPVDVRVMAATNRDLNSAVKQERFRQDLFYRLGVVTLEVPPLRERREDVPRLAERVMRTVIARLGSRVEYMSDDAMEALIRYDWPGNVRELMNAIERAVLLCESRELTLSDLPAAIGGPPPMVITAQHEAAGMLGPSLPPEWLKQPLREIRQRVIDSVEKAYLTELLKDTRGRIGETARRAGLQPRSLFEKMRRYSLRKEDYKDLRS